MWQFKRWFKTSLFKQQPENKNHTDTLSTKSCLFLSADENDRSCSIEPMAAGYIALQDEHRNRARSLSADSTRPEHDRGSCYFGESQHDFRRKASRQNSYLEAIKQVGGGKSTFL